MKEDPKTKDEVKVPEATTEDTKEDAKDKTDDTTKEKEKEKEEEEVKEEEKEEDKEVGRRVVNLQQQGPHCTWKTGKMAKIIPCQGKHREFGNFAKTQGISFCSSCKFPDSKGKRCFNICR